MDTCALALERQTPPEAEKGKQPALQPEGSTVLADVHLHGTFSVWEQNKRTAKVNYSHFPEMWVVPCHFGVWEHQNAG